MRSIKIMKIASRARGVSSFKMEQNEMLRKAGILVDELWVERGGIRGYCMAICKYRKRLSQHNYDIIHAHDLSSCISIFQRRIPIIMSFHGNDLYDISTRIICNIASKFAKYVILSSPGQINYLYCKPKSRYGILNSGIDLSIFYPIDKMTARAKMGLDLNEKYVLFSSTFDNKVKNYKLARAAVERIDQNITLIELKGYSREEVALLMAAVDLLLVTSKTETGPNVTKEALACNTPVVSTNVGHAELINILEETPGCYVTGWNAEEIANAILDVLNNSGETHTRHKVKVWSMDGFIEKTIQIYNMVFLGKLGFVEYPETRVLQ